LIEKQDQMTKAIQRQLKQCQQENEQLRNAKSDSDTLIAQLKNQVDKIQQENSKNADERDLSKE